MTETPEQVPPAPAVGQLWLIGNDRCYLRSWNKYGRHFVAYVINERRRVIVTPEFLEDAMHAKYIGTPNIAIDDPDESPSPRQLRDAANGPWEE